MAVVTIRQLLDSGVHFGHQTRRWNPKVKRFIFTERSGIYIIDLQQTLGYIDKAYEFVKSTVAHGGNILFVGTKKQAQEAIASEAQRVGQPFINHRWLGGLLTNFQTVHKRLLRLKELQAINYDDPAGSGHTKKELLLLSREKDKLEKTLGGIQDLSRTPNALWVVDTNKEHLAVQEANKLGIPVVAVLDTNCDPDEITYPVPGNDDAIRSVSLLTKIIADAVAAGLIERHSQQTEGEGEAAEPLAEWERELLAQGSTAEGTPAQSDAAKAQPQAAGESDQAATATASPAQPVPAAPVPASAESEAPQQPAASQPAPQQPAPAASSAADTTANTEQN